MPSSHFITYLARWLYRKWSENLDVAETEFCQCWFQNCETRGSARWPLHPLWSSVPLWLRTLCRAVHMVILFLSILSDWTSHMAFSSVARQPCQAPLNMSVRWGGGKEKQNPACWLCWTLKRKQRHKMVGPGLTSTAAKPIISMFHCVSRNIHRGKITVALNIW